MKRAILPICLLAAGLVGSFAIIEVGLRLMPIGTKNVLRERPVQYYHPPDAPNMRGNSIDPEEKGDLFRVAVVGDSFTFGPKLQIYDTFPKRLEWLLNVSQTEPHFEVLNYGTPGASTHHEVDLVHKALVAKADLVILEITLNDAQERPLTEEPVEFSGKGDARGLEWAFNKSLGWSRVYQFVHQRINNYRSVSRYIDYHHSLFNESHTWEKFQASVDKMREDANAMKKPFVAVLFPLFDFPLDERYPFHDLHKKIKAVFQSRHIPFLDLEDAYRGVDPKRIQLIPGADSHPNEIGHRIAAEAIFLWLLQTKLLPSAATPARVYKNRDSVNESIVTKRAIYPRKKSR